MVAGNAPRLFARGSHGGDRERRGVAREDAVLAHDVFQLGEEDALRREVLDDRFDHQVARREGLHSRHHLDALHDGLRILDAALLRELGERLRDRVDGALRRPGLRVVEQCARARLGEDLRNAAPHGAGTGDGRREIAAGNIKHEGADIVAAGAL